MPKARPYLYYDSTVSLCAVCLRRIEANADSGPHRSGYRDLATIERMLDAARRRPIRHLMLNTNGIRIANESDFAQRLAGYAPAFEVYLQWDSTRATALKSLRGIDLTSVRDRALQNLNRVGLSTTLVMVIDAYDFDVRAMKKSCVHIVQADGRVIPFEAFNLLYRDARRDTLEMRRAEVKQMFPARKHPAATAPGTA